MDKSEKSQKYLIQGVFFQDYQQLEVAQLSEVGGGAQVVIRGGLYQFMFQGIIFSHPYFMYESIGEMSDHFGASELSDIFISIKEFTFSKRYLHRQSRIQYSFSKRRDGVWLGSYEGEDVSPGHANCIINQIPDNFFLP